MLIAHMEILHEPEDGNYPLFCQAKSALRAAMDTILRSPPAASQQSGSPNVLSSAELVSSDWMLSDHFGLGLDSW